MMFLFCNPLFNPFVCPDEQKRTSLVASYKEAKDQYPSDVIKRASSSSPTTATVSSLVSGSWSFDEDDQQQQEAEEAQRHNDAQVLVANLLQVLSTNEEQQQPQPSLCVVTEEDEDEEEAYITSYQEMEALFRDKQMVTPKNKINNTDSGLLLTPELLLEHMTSPRSEASKLRLDILQQELDDIITECIKSGMDVEDELIEALGIAANQVAYIAGQASCRQSVAYAIVKGDLLQVARYHYFGSSRNFKVDCAPMVKATVENMKSGNLYHGDNYEYERVPLSC